MLTSLHRYRLLNLTIATAAALVVLIGLGAWQLSRRIEKEHLNGLIKERGHLEPVSLGTVLRRRSEGQDVDFTRVSLDGRFVNKAERHQFVADSRGPGYRIVTPFVLTDGGAALVDRGYVPERFKDARARAEGQIEGDIHLLARVAPFERHGPFTPPSDASANLYFFADVDGMSRAVSAWLPSGTRLAPFILEAEPTLVPGGWPKPDAGEPTLANPHLAYALTWFGLALTLAAVYASVVLTRLSEARALSRPAG